MIQCNFDKNLGLIIFSKKIEANKYEDSTKHFSYFDFLFYQITVLNHETYVVYMLEIYSQLW